MDYNQKEIRLQEDKLGILEILDEETSEETSVAESLRKQDLYDRQTQREMRLEVKAKAFRILYFEILALFGMIILQGFKLFVFCVNH